MVLAGWWAPLEEGHRESGCWESVALQRVGRAGGLGALTVDLHMEGQAGAARCIAGSAAVVAAVGCAQGLQLEESALLGELGVGICLERPPHRVAVPHQCGARPGQLPRQQGRGTSGTGPQPLHWCPTEGSLGKQAPLGGKGVLPGAPPSGLLQGAHAQSRSWSLAQIYNP